MRKVHETLGAFGRKHVRLIVDLSLILAVTIIVFRNWIFSSQWPAGGDMLGWISREYLYWIDYRWLFVWRPNSFGYPEGVNLMDFFFMLLHSVAGNAANTAKVFGILLFALSGFAMYAFGFHCTKRNLPALAGSLVYLLNGQFLTQLTEAHLDIMFSYAIAPFIFLFLDRALETGKMKDIIASSIFLGIMLTGFQPEMIVIYGVFVALFAIINLLRSQKSMRFRDSIRFRLKTIISILAFVALLSACSWVPLLFNVRAPYLSTTFSRGNLEDAYTYGYKTFAEAFTLTGKEAYGYVNTVNVETGASIQFLPVPTILLIVFAFAYITTLVIKLNRYSFFFGLSALISIILAMGPYSFGSSFLWAWANVPYYAAFRAISRWDLMTAFSNSFFVCVSTSILISYLLKASRKPEKEYKVCMNFPNNSQDQRNLGDSGADLDKILHSARRYLYYAAIFALLAILMTGFLSTWFLFSQGLQVYTPPSDYLQPYEYLNNISGGYKVITVGRSSNDWYSTSGQDMDFVGGMLTPIGWSHDIGYESTFIDNKPTLQDGGLSPLSNDFVDYLRFYLAENNITRNLLKLLGAFDYKYVVIPSYAPETTRTLFMSQYGGHLIYNQSDSIILENEFYTPSIFGPAQYALVFGGPDSLSSLCGISSFDLNQTAFISMYQVNDLLTFVRHHLNDTATLVFADADPEDLLTMDLLMMSSNDAHLIYLANYGLQSINSSAYWVKNGYWTNDGAPVLGGDVLTTSGKNEINVPVELNTEGDYDIFIRAGFAPSRGELHVSIDGLPIAEVYPYSNYPSGLQWINLTSNYPLEAGSHLITLVNDGSGYNDLDAIAIVQHSKLATQEQETVNTLQSFTGRILYVIGAAEAFSKTLPTGWSIQTIPGEGYALQMEDGVNIASQASASASSVGDSGTLVAQNAIDGNPSTRWASAVGMPQWLEVTFPTPREIDGVEINFEASYAKDYQIQTWNGTGWVDQIVVENNSLVNRQDVFAQAVTTEKLRILVTSAPMNSVVSIYELKLISDIGAPSSQISVPRTGEYNYAARLFPTTNGTLYLKVDEKLFSISCPANLSTATWFELGSAQLNVGEHNMTVFALGNVTTDKIGVYSASDKVSTIDDAFNSTLSTPSVTCEEVNPCKYVAHVNCSSPFFLVFSESYNPLWKAYVSNEEISPVIVDMLANGFFINRTGSFDIVLYFTGQNIADIGLIISVGGIILVILVVLTKSTLDRKVRHFIINQRLFKRS